MREAPAARVLAATIRTQLIAPLYRMNGCMVEAPRIAWGREIEITPDMLKSLREAGIDYTGVLPS